MRVHLNNYLDKNLLLKQIDTSQAVNKDKSKKKQEKVRKISTL